MEWISTGNEFKKKNLFSWISHDASIILNDGRIVSIKPSCMKQIWYLISLLNILFIIFETILMEY